MAFTRLHLLQIDGARTGMTSPLALIFFLSSPLLLPPMPSLYLLWYSSPSLSRAQCNSSRTSRPPRVIYACRARLVRFRISVIARRRLDEPLQSAGTCAAEAECSELYEGLGFYCASRVTSCNEDARINCARARFIWSGRENESE